MAYQAIYRKWRPTVFEDVVGQSHITDTLKTELLTGKIAHAYLFCGTRGTGKTTTAKILSRAINCEHLTKDGNPCNECDSCKGILNNNIMDVVEIDAASNNGVENIRELRDEVIYTPADVKYKVYIIDEVHMLSQGAFNALLKTLEEPPKHAIFILATTEPQKIPATIQSRCQRFDFKRIALRFIAGRIAEITRKDNMDISDDAIKLIAQLGDGSMRDALSVLDLCSGMTGKITREDIENVTGAVNRDTILDIAGLLIEKNISEALTKLSEIVSSGRDVTNLMETLTECFREILICKMVKNPENVLDRAKEDIEKSISLSENIGTEELLYIVKMFCETISSLKNITMPRIIIESAFIKACNPSLSLSNEATLTRIKNLENLVLGNGEIKFKPRINKTPDEISKENIAIKNEYEEEKPIHTKIEFEEKPVVENSEVENIQVENETSKQMENVPSNSEEIKNIILKNNPALGVMIKEAKFNKTENGYNIVFASKQEMEIVGSKTFMEDLVKALQTDKIKLLCNEDNMNNIKDPFDDIINMSNNFNEINIIE